MTVPEPVSLDGDWELCGLPSASVDDPLSLSPAGSEWIPAQVPGTVAGALSAAGRLVDRGELDDLDWWYRCRLRGSAGRHRIELGGLATIADVWLGGRHLLHSENMHRSRAVAVELTGDDELVVRCAALSAVLERRRPRPRWKTYLVDHQQLRWVRTSLLGRIQGWAKVPPAVGVWRPVRVTPADGTAACAVELHAVCDATGPGGRVSAKFELPGAELTALGGAVAVLRAGGSTAPLSVHQSEGGLALEGTVALPQVERWWPHTHGPQPLYDVSAVVAGRSHHLGRAGFRTVEVDRSGGGFRLEVNGEPVFVRGATWLPPDPVTLNVDTATEARLCDLVLAAGMNMLRLPGTAVYETQRFFDRCDQLGIMVWQDAMFAFMDPPADEQFAEEAATEVREALRRLGGRPSIAVVCGNQEVDEVAAMLGLGRDERATPLFDKTIAAVAAEVLPGVPYVASNPTGGDVPFRMGEGVSQYFGVGGYLRPIEDARRSRVRFAAECLAFATPPEPQTVEERCGGAWRAGHDPAWKEGVHHDAGRSWDMEDVRDHYVASLFGAEPRAERYRDAERALELGRAVNARLMEAVLTEWRRPGSWCDGGLVLAFSDLRPGAGWGLVDAAGRPKAPWYALRRVLAPVALLATDEGLDGLALHVVNDRPEPLRAVLAVELVAEGSLVVERGEVAVEVAARSSWTVGAEQVLGSWRDVTYSYRFAPPGHDAVVATLLPAGTGETQMLSQVVHLPLGQARAVEADLGLAALARRQDDGRWEVEVSTSRLAQWTTIRAPGFVPADSWFHMPPGAVRTVDLWQEPGSAGAVPSGAVGALNSRVAAPIRVVTE
ncbi:MAG: glycosyl hydrolase 2 galactose-binding domain-containing protein [Acidimicrobiales bacterium]